MHQLTSRACFASLRSINPTGCAVAPARVILGRLDAHLKRRTDRRCISATARTRIHTQAESVGEGQYNEEQLHVAPNFRGTASAIQDYTRRVSSLPRSCPGCGALTQQSDQGSAGFYSRSRKAIKQYLKHHKKEISLEVQSAGEGEGGDASTKIEREQEDGVYVVKDSNSDADVAVPVCDRCHDLIYNNKGISIAHPTIENIADSIAESPFRRNHIFHVLDAADFPMSLVPDIFTQLTVAKPRSQNRRSQHDFSNKPTVSFIITRSDLLGATKEAVDSMMFPLQQILRQALSRQNRDIRLGNIHLVSAKRGWWTKEIKEDIWKRGGGNWMVGKVNVGKSALFEVLFPKGSGERAPVYAELRKQQELDLPSDTRTTSSTYEEESLSEDSLLPPAQEEKPFPVFPVVSSLPGTTASPIRLPFGNNRGELIDLPGLARGNLEDYVKPEHSSDLVMTHREDVEQHIIKPGQSLVLGGGLIRITPKLDEDDKSTTVSAYSFVPLKSHVTNTEKARSLQEQTGRSSVGSILRKDAGPSMKSAGRFVFNTDVTKARTGPMMRAGVDVKNLPFRVLATDILIEGLGWVELVCQTRRPRRRSDPQAGMQQNTEGESSATEGEERYEPLGSSSSIEHVASRSDCQLTDDGFILPEVEVITPNGNHISQRPSLGIWLRWSEGRIQKDRGPRAARHKAREKAAGVQRKVRQNR